MCFNVGFKEKKYTKRDAFVLMDCDTEIYSETDQRLGGFIVVKKTSLSDQQKEQVTIKAQQYYEKLQKLEKKHQTQS